MGESNHAVKIDIAFRKKPFEINGLWLGEVIGALDPGVEINAVNVWMRFRDPTTHVNMKLDWNI